MKTQRTITIKVFSWLINLIILFSCTTCTHIQDSGFKYEREFRDYLLDIFKVESTSNVIYYVFPMSSCSFCTKESLNILKKSKSKNVVLLLIGDINGKDEEEILKLPIPKLFDINQNAYSYGFGLAKPLIVHINKKKVINFFEVNDTDLKTAQNYILSH